MVADLTKGKPDIIGVCELRDAQAKKVFTPLMEDAGYFAAYVGAGNGLYLRRGTKFRSRGTYYLPKAVQGKGRREALLRCRVKDRKSTRLNSSHVKISYAVFCLKKKTPSLRLTLAFDYI